MRSNCAKCVKCQIFGTFGTLNTKNPLYQIFQILLFLPHVNNTFTNLPLYGQLWHKFFFFNSTFSLISSSVSPSNPNPLLSNPILSLCLPFPVSLGTVTLLGLSAFMLTKMLTFSAFRDPIPWLIMLTFFFAHRFIKIGLRNRIAY